MGKAELTPGFLIHRRAFKDSSLLLDFLTLEYGKIRLIGKGARKSKTNIQMFQRLDISFIGKRSLKTLTHWEVSDTPRILTGEALILAMYVNELLSRLLQDDDPHFKLFKLYQQFINQLAKLERNLSHWHLHLFENNLLTQLGYELDLSVDIDENPIDGTCLYEYQPQVGFSLSTMGKISGKLIHQLRANTLDKIPDAGQIKVCRDLNRTRLAPLLGDKPLKSRELYFRGV